MDEDPGVLHQGDSDRIDQIEYRHLHVQDLAPFASTMSPAETNTWDRRIRDWVRHPPADRATERITESVCYQLFPGTQEAALAWRSVNPEAGLRADGTEGRPLVSRVLVGPDHLLSPELAISLCRTGLPDFAQPGLIGKPGELWPIGSGDLAVLVGGVIDDLDEAAGQASGLTELIAAVLEEQSKPLAVYLPVEAMTCPLPNAPQGLLLWGLYRIMGLAPKQWRRGWSFSTFERPLGTQGVETLPDIVFRHIQEQSTPAGMRRQEISVRPLAPKTLARFPQTASLARRMVTLFANDGQAGLISKYTRPRDVQAGVDEADADTDATKHDGAEPGPAKADSAEHGSAGSDLAAPEPAELLMAAPAEAPAEPVAAGGPADQPVPMVTGAYSWFGGESKDVSPASGPSADGPAAVQAHPDALASREPKAAAYPGIGPDPAVGASPDTGASTPVVEGDQEPGTREPTEAYHGTEGHQDTRAYQEAESQPPSEAPARDRQPRNWNGDPREPDPGSLDPRPDRPAWNKTLLSDLVTPRPGIPDPLPDPVTPPPPSLAPEMTPSRLTPYVPARSAEIGRLIGQLREVTNPTGLRGILEAVAAFPGDIDPADRVMARRALTERDWYESIAKRTGYRLNGRELAAIFRLAVIPDLGKDDMVSFRVREWAEHADPVVIVGLLIAADETPRGRGKWSVKRDSAATAVRQLLEPVLARRWLHENEIRAYWDANYH